MKTRTRSSVVLGLVLGMTLFLLFLLPGCVRSVHPLYKQDDIIFDSSLLGAWTAVDKDSSWQFVKSTEDKHDQSYRLVVTNNDGQPGTFLAHLVTLGEHRFLDLYPVAPKISNNGFYKLHYQPAHTFIRVERDGDRLSLAPLHIGWVNKYLSENPDAVTHTRVTPSGHPTAMEDAKDRTVLLTAPTAELQQFLKKHADNSDAFADPIELKAVR